MGNSARYLAQAMLYALFFLPIVYITQNPVHVALGKDMAVLKLAVRHAGAIIGECTPVAGAVSTEVAQVQGKLPATTKRPQICPRERAPLQIELWLDGEILYSALAPASGLHSDGVSSIYKRFRIPAGEHMLQLRMNDDSSRSDFNWTLEQSVELQAAQVIVASFKEGFRLQ